MELFPILGHSPPGDGHALAGQQLTQPFVAERSVRILFPDQAGKLQPHGLTRDTRRSPGHGTGEEIPQRERALAALEIFSPDTPADGGLMDI